MLKMRILINVIVLALFLSACGGMVLETPDPNTPVDSNQQDELPPGAEPPSGELIEDIAYINQMDLMIMESYPVQIALNLKGELPTPCHYLEVEVGEPNALNEIHVRVYSVTPLDATCVMVLEPFEANISIPMAGAADGMYTVFVNGEKAGEFSYPG